MTGEVKRQFATRAERDAWIDRHYPDREATSTPGLYAVPGGALGVFLLEVTVYPGPRPRTTYRADA